MNDDKKTVLVTGSKGFIGTHLTRALQKKNSYHVLEFNHAVGDIANYKFEIPQLDHVIHLAAKTFVPHSWEMPYDFYKTNVLGTVNILELCRKHNASITYISAYVYGKPEYLPIDENHHVNGDNPYMHSKIEAESVCRFYALNYNIPVTVIRPFNIYGPGQSGVFLIPKIIKQILSNDSEVSVFSLQPKRDFVFINDFIESILVSMEYNHNFETFNIGSGESFSVEDIIKICFQITQNPKNIICENVERKNEIMDVIANINKAKDMLNWEPRTTFAEGLKKIIQHEQL